MTKTELLRFRAEDFAARFQALRETEWALAFQVFAGYAAIGYGFGEAIRHTSHLYIVFSTAIVLSLVLLCVHCYMRIRTQERLEEFRRLMIAYLEDLHRDVGVPEKPFNELKDQKWYALASQLIISVVFASAASLYVFEVSAVSLCTDFTASNYWILGLRLAGVCHFVTLVAACFTPIPTNWDKNLAGLPEIHRRFAVAQNFFIGATIAFCGLVSLFFAPELVAGSTTARIICAGIALWWGGRLIVLQWLKVWPHVQSAWLKIGFVLLQIECAVYAVAYGWLAVRP